MFLSLQGRSFAYSLSDAAQWKSERVCAGLRSKKVHRGKFLRPLHVRQLAVKFAERAREMSPAICKCHKCSLWRGMEHRHATARPRSSPRDTVNGSAQIQACTSRSAVIIVSAGRQLRACHDIERRDIRHDGPFDLTRRAATGRQGRWCGISTRKRAVVLNFLRERILFEGKKERPPLFTTSTNHMPWHRVDSSGFDSMTTLILGSPSNFATLPVAVVRLATRISAT